MKKFKLSCLILASALWIQIPAQTEHPHKISKKISVPGDGSWDLLTIDEPAQHLFLSHNSVVNIVDLKTYQVIGTIKDTKGVHGIAIAGNLNKGFTSNGRDTSVTIFNSKTFEIIEKVKIPGINPDAILYDAFTQKVFIFNGRSNDATVMDGKTNKVLGTIKLSGKPELCINNDKGIIFVNIEDKNSITVIDAITLKIKNEWSIAPGEEPTGLAFDSQANRLFSVCGNKLMVVVNAENGKVITTLPIGEGCDGVAFDPEKKYVYASNGADGSITIVKEENANKFMVIETLATQKGAKTIALNTSTHQLFLPTAEYGERPEPTKDNPKPRPVIKPNSFTVLVVE
jgi:DNA-binding beta-propeller fold protein YncE